MSFYLVQQFDALGREVRAQAGAGEYRGALRDGHPMVAAGLVDLRQHHEARGVELRDRLGLARDEVAHMGDDLPDLPALAEAGFAVAPANAHPWVAERVHWVTPARGGDGAARQLCDLILQARGHRDAVLAGFAR